jgi:hypothetical protein
MLEAYWMVAAICHWKYTSFILTWISPQQNLKRGQQ